MSLQVRLKLKLTKKRKSIILKYNTFELATFDQYLCASIVLRAKDDKEIDNYIDDITGAGSLNLHFKNLCDETMSLNQKQLNDIMQNSLYPILKMIDIKYDFYSQLNVSVCQGRVYNGDFGKHRNVKQELQISEKIIEQETKENKSITNAEPYLVKFDGNEIFIELENKWLKITEKSFKKLIVKEPNTISNKFKGTIHNGADGDGWNILTKFTINNLFFDKRYFYNDGDHYKIRNNGFVKTALSQVAELHIYKEEFIPYENNKNLCNQAIDTLLNFFVNEDSKIKILLKIICNVDDLVSQKAINKVLSVYDSKELSLYGIELIKNGLETGWENTSLQNFIRYNSDSLFLNDIYRINSDLEYSIEQLLQIQPNILTNIHKKIIEDYKCDFERKISLINSIIGEVTNSGMREKIKQLKSNADTKRFSKLSNELQGHVKDNINEVSMDKLDTWLAHSIEYKNLMIKLQSNN